MEVYSYKVVFQFGVAVRVSPAINADKTGEIIPFGTVLESTKSLFLDGVNYVKLSDDRGWIFSHKDTVKVLDLIEVTRRGAAPSIPQPERSRTPSAENISSRISSDSSSPTTISEGETRDEDLFTPSQKPRRNLSHLLLSPSTPRKTRSNQWREIRQKVRACTSFDAFSELVLSGLPAELQPPAIPEPGPARSAWMSSSDDNDQYLRAKISILASITRHCADMIADVSGLESHLWVIVHLGAADSSHVLRLFDVAAQNNFDNLIYVEYRAFVLSKLDELNKQTKVHAVELGRLVDMLPDELRHFLQRWVMIKVTERRSTTGIVGQAKSSKVVTSGAKLSMVANGAANSSGRLLCSSWEDFGPSDTSVSDNTVQPKNTLWQSLVSNCLPDIFENNNVDDCEGTSASNKLRKPPQSIAIVARFLEDVQQFAYKVSTDLSR